MRRFGRSDGEGGLSRRIRLVTYATPLSTSNGRPGPWTQTDDKDGVKFHGATTLRLELATAAGVDPMSYAKTFAAWRPLPAQRVGWTPRPRWTRRCLGFEASGFA